MHSILYLELKRLKSAVLAEIQFLLSPHSMVSEEQLTGQGNRWLSVLAWGAGGGGAPSGLLPPGQREEEDPVSQDGG